MEALDENTLATWRTLQEQIASQVITTDSFVFENIKLVGGLDISFSPKDPNIGCAYITVIKMDTLEPVYEDYAVIHLTVPYVSGFLAFREFGFYQTLMNRIPSEFKPDVIMVDGNGILHHCGAGSATHLGVMFDVPTIGVAKTLLSLDGMYEKKIKETIKKGKLTHYPLIGSSGKTYGIALVGPGCINPVFVSLGHKISLETAVKVVEKTMKHKNPEPIRISDIKSKLHFEDKDKDNDNN